MGATRLFFGNPVKQTDTKPFPQNGQRLCYGEKQLEQKEQPKINPNSTMLAFGNHSVNSQPDTPFEAVNGVVQWTKTPKF